MTDSHELGRDHPKGLGHYEITGVLGTGAQGAVYDALDRTSHRRVMIQAMKPPFDANADAAPLPAQMTGRQGRYSKITRCR